MYPVTTMSGSSTPSPRYRVVGQLGHGGMGVVMRVHDTVRDEMVAQKRIRRASSSRILRFKREFRAVERLSHPNLIRLYELDEDENGLFYTMEAVDGVDLLTYCWGAAALGASTTTLIETGVDAGDQDYEPPTRTSDSGNFSSAAFSLRAACDLSFILDRLRTVLPQIISALDYLHTSGLVHRDLKPENVLVTRSSSQKIGSMDLIGPFVDQDDQTTEKDVIKLLDFGILADLRAGRGRGKNEIVGTLSYMAPEQLSGHRITPAADLYALGSVLFRVISGHHVFEGSTEQVKRALAETPAPALSSLIEGVPAYIERACARLLDKDPARRISLPDLCRDLLEPLGAEIPILQQSRTSGPIHVPLHITSDLIGRGDLQARLRHHVAAIQRGAARIVTLTGPTGAGKTALADWLAGEAEVDDTLVLRSRCRPNERVPFNAIDGIIDDLAMWFGGRSRPRPEEIIDKAVLAASAFPVLGLAPAHAPRRSLAFDAVIDLIEYAASHGNGAVLLIDDLQWADADSLAFLQRLAEHLEKGTIQHSVAILATVRDDVRDSAGRTWVDGWIQRSAGAERVEVTPLEPAAIAEIIEIIAARGNDPSHAASLDHADLIEKLAMACAGRPYLAEVAGRALVTGVYNSPAADRPDGDELHAAGSAAGGDSGVRQDGAAPTDLVSALVRDTGPLARELLALLLAADGWLTFGDLTEIVGRSQGEVIDTLSGLGRRGLVRRAGPTGPRGQADIYHDTVRDATRDVLGPDALARAHGAIADFLSMEPEPHVGRRIRHLLGAGRPLDAAEHAPRAAAYAEAMCAFALAADMYAVVLQHGEVDDDRESWLRRYASVLERGGRYLEGAAVWREICQLAVGHARVDAALNEARDLMAANDIGGGYAQLNAALSAAGEPAIGGGKISGLIQAVGFLRGPLALGPGRRAHGDIDAVRTLAENDVRLGQLIGYFDPISGIRFLRRAQRTFHRAGDDESVAWIDYIFAYLAIFSNPRRGPVPLSRRYLDAGKARLRGLQVDNYELLALPDLVVGVTAERDARWDEADEYVDQALTRAEAAGLVGTFAYMFAAIHRAQIALGRQDVRRAIEIQTWLRGVARESSDSALLCHVEFAQVQLDMYRGDLRRSAAHGEHVTGTWPTEQPTFQRFLAEVWRAAPHIYHGDCHRQRRQLAAAVTRLRKLRPLRNMYCGVSGSIIALTEANAYNTGDHHASLRVVRRMARLCATAPPRLAPGGLRAMAYVTDDQERAVAMLERAADEARQSDQSIDAAIADFQRGARLGGSEGDALCARARAAIAAVGASEIILHEDAARR